MSTEKQQSVALTTYGQRTQVNAVHVLYYEKRPNAIA
jgi:hypothetical protein